MTRDRESTSGNSRTLRQPALGMDAETFRRLGYRLVDQVAEHLEAIPHGPVMRDESSAAVREALDLDGPLPESGMDAASLLERTTELLFDHSLFNAHPRFFGYITGAPSPLGMLGDFLASALNPNVGARILSPAATEIERQTVRWIAEFIGYPAQTGGLLVSGGNMANIVGFLAARAAKAGWNIREDGVAHTGHRLRVYASTETHTWIQKAADMTGLGTSAIRWIPTDATLRMDVAALRRQIETDTAAGDIPFIVVGTAGSVSTGVVDPLADIAAVCQAFDVWFHVDGAYGGVAAALTSASSELSPEVMDDLRGLELADSVAVDPHKWLYAPLEAGCALVRDRHALTAAFAYHPPYYHFDEDATNYVDYGPQNSRGFRALKIWLALRHVGAAAYRTMIAEDIQLSRVMAKAVASHPDLELATQALSIATFRYVPHDLRPRIGEPDIERHLDALNRELLDRLQRGGETFVSNAVIGGRYLLRACIVNFHTDRADVEAVPEIAARIGRAVDAELRQRDGGLPA